LQSRRAKRCAIVVKPSVRRSQVTHLQSLYLNFLTDARQVAYAVDGSKHARQPNEPAVHIGSDATFHSHSCGIMPMQRPFGRTGRGIANPRPGIESNWRRSDWHRRSYWNLRPASGLTHKKTVGRIDSQQQQEIIMAYELPPLPYDYAALEPHIDEATMKLHHDKHHQAYVTNLNGAVEKHPDLGKHTPEELIKDLAAIPEDVRKVVQNNGGGHVNHTMFWQIMKPHGGGEPAGPIAEQIKADFGDFETFKKTFNETTAKQFGSGWGWLIFTDGKLKIVTTANQDNPISTGHYPILGNDVWEHAYYLKYQNKRPDYLAAWWNTVNWDEINKRFKHAQK
jgi:Fe-Mn family superoxide dismutase